MSAAIKVHEPTKCSGFVDGKCKHGHPITAVMVCAGHHLLERQREGDTRPYRLRESLMVPACVDEAAAPHPNTKENT